MTDEVRKLIGSQTDSGTIEQAAMARRHDHDARGRRRQMPRRRDHRAPRFSASRRVAVMPMPNFRYRALTQMANWSPARSRRRAPGEVAQRIERLGLVLVDTVTRGGRGSAALVFSFSSASAPRAEDVTMFTRDLALLLQGRRADQ